MPADDVAGAVVVLIEGGAPVWTGSFGMADPATGRPMGPDALFRVESISKPVTAWGAMRLAETGRLDLDAPIGDCLTRWHLPDGAARITPRDLLSHSAGIGLVLAALSLRTALRGGQRPLVARIMSGAIGTALVLWPLWAAAQAYLFLFSILPGLWPWLGAASGLAGLGLASVALGPRRSR
jgi:CubicO group peptidase (beta-lactamase class C family)